MKKLTAKLKPTKDSHSADPKHTYRRVECEECDTIFNIPVSEITRGAYGCPMAKCPRCVKRTYVRDCSENDDFILNENNLIFPNHFFVMDSIDEVDFGKMDITGTCRKTIHDFLEDKNGEKYGDYIKIEGGHVALIALKNERDHEIEIFVCNGYYHTAIPETEIFQFPKINTYL